MSKLVYEGYYNGRNSGGASEDLFIYDPATNTTIAANITGLGAQPFAALNVASTIDGPELISYNGFTYLNAGDSSGSKGLFVVDDSTGKGHELVGSEGLGNKVGINPQDFIVYDKKVYFNGADGNGDSYLFSTTGGTPQEYNGNNAPQDPQFMAVYDNKLFMNADSSLYAFDDKTNQNQYQDVAAGLNPTDLTVSGVGTQLFDPFTGKAGAPLTKAQDLYMNGNGALYVYDGSGSPTPISNASVNPEDIVATPLQIGVELNGPNKLDLFQQNGVYFSGADNNKGDRGLWFSDGTAGGTKEIASSSSFGVKDLDPRDITVDGPVVFFTANDGLFTDSAGHPGRGLFAYVAGETTVELVKSSQYNLTDGYLSLVGGDQSPTLALVNGNLYFGASHTGASGQAVPQLYELGANGQPSLVTQSSATSGLVPTNLSHT
jgi:hypothetical protein